MKEGFLYLMLAVTLFSCGNQPKEEVTVPTVQKLPFLGEPQYEYTEKNGVTIVDTIQHTIPPFSFTDQDGQTVTEKTVTGKIYVADFFFTTCPSICPIMTGNLKTVQDEFKDNQNIMILSHSIDPDHDTPQVLKKFATDLGVEGNQWQFLTGEKEKIYEIGQKNYLSTAKEDKTADGGYIHSGAFILVDKEKHVRGMYDGTTEEGTQKLIADIKTLLDEYKQ